MSLLTLAAILFTSWLLIKLITGLRIDYTLGILIYGGVLVGMRIAGAGKKFTRRLTFKKPERRVRLEPITQVSQIEARYKLKEFEVVIGFGGIKPIKVDFREHHTLVGGVSGWGKTTILNMILVGLFSKGKRFTDACDVYLIDLKGNEKDYLHLWKPLLAGYFSITEDKDAIEAIRTLNRIVEDMHRKHKTGDNQKRILVIIDEIAMLTTMSSDKKVKEEGVAALNRLCGQLRASGTIIAATQYPKYDVIPTSSRFNMDRRICLYTSNVSEAQIVLGTKPDARLLPTQKGEFLLREPGRAGLIQGRSMNVETPGEIDRAVCSILDISLEDDPRLRLFAEVAKGKETCDKIVGVNAIYKQMGMTSAEVKHAYRHFVLAGAFSPPPTERGSSYTLAVSYEEGFMKIRKYIEQGRWHSKPPEAVAGKDISENNLNQ